MTGRAEDRIVVIGSGPSGAMAAHELVAAGADVTMLEAGTKPPKGIIVRAAGHTLLRWRAGSMTTDRHVAAGDPETEWYTTLEPGGLSNYWTAAVPRFAPEDFTDGGRIDERLVWPITYDELVPAYEAAEDLLCITGPAQSIPVLPKGRARYRHELPADWEAMAEVPAERSLVSMPLARGTRWMLARRGSEFNSYHVIVAPLASSASFEMRRGAFATRLLVDGDGACTGVEYRSSDTGELVQLRARAVVVAAGALDSTRLLLSSRSTDHPTGIGNEHGLLGTHLTDHPREWWRAEFVQAVSVIDHPAYLARAPYASSVPLGGASATIGLARSRDRLVAMRGGTGNLVGVQVFGTMVPDADGRVRLLEDRLDAWGAPMLEITSRYDDDALATLTEARARFEEAFAAAGNPVRVHLEPWRPRPGSSVHHAGTARMHARPDLGVVDAWNRVHSMPNVVVVDMACFTTNPEKNPTLTAMALAARAARRLAADTA